MKDVNIKTLYKTKEFGVIGTTTEDVLLLVLLARHLHGSFSKDCKFLLNLYIQRVSAAPIPVILLLTWPSH